MAVILFLESLGGGELLIILLFVLIFFGSDKIPSLARGLGKGMRELRDAMQGVQSEISDPGIRTVLEEGLVTEIFEEAWKHQFDEDRSQIARTFREIVREAIAGQRREE